MGAVSKTSSFYLRCLSGYLTLATPTQSSIIHMNILAHFNCVKSDSL